MSFVRMLGMAKFVPEKLASKSEMVIEKDGDGFSITSVHLTVAAKIPGIGSSISSVRGVKLSSHDLADGAPKAANESDASIRLVCRARRL
jgi:hypothetical protein